MCAADIRAPIADNDILANCYSPDVVVTFVPGRGRVLKATREIAPFGMLLSAPLEYRVGIPGIAKHPVGDQAVASNVPSGLAPDADDYQQHLSRDFARVVKICTEVGNLHGADTYWAAMLSLTEQERPASHGWPSISAEKQERLLLLYRPEHISSTCSGRCLATEAGCTASPEALSEPPSPRSDGDPLGAGFNASSGLPKRAAKFAPTFDLVVPRLQEEFGLSVAASKLEDLVLVWKYNAFDGDVTGDLRELHLYVAPSMLSHSCSPNCVKQYGEAGEMEILAGIGGLTVGDEATISYLETGALERSTLCRREVLACSWLFYCECLTCKSVEAPSCPACLGNDVPSMVVCMSMTEEPLYPGHDVVCDSCLEEDLQASFGYFFHCMECDTDFCPPCAIRKLYATGGGAQEENAIDGCWWRKEGALEVGGMEIIAGDTILWAQGGNSKITMEDASALKFSTVVDQSPVYAEIIDGEMVWSDGDIWVRQQASSGSAVGT